jgi:Kdo2-lipid IVA lauroyltransferase/acyltransferase
MARRSRFKALKNGLLYRALLGAFAVGRNMSLDGARATGRRIGGLAHLVAARERRKALETAAVAFPEWTPERRAAMVASAFRHLGESLFEILWMPNLDRPTMERTTVFEGLENMRRAIEPGRGVVLFTGHCGNWEWMAASIALAGFEMNVIAREIYDPRINDFIVESRARFGMKTIGRGTGDAARDILKTLRTGAILGVLIDQNIRAESAKVPFFGRPVETPVGPARLAIRAGSAAIAGFIERREGRQVIRFEEPIATSRDMDAVELTGRLTQSIENQIRMVPEQWVWMHQRWRDRPPRQA